MPRVIIIPFSWGEVHNFIECLRHAVKHRDIEVLRKGWWLYREHVRRGTWEPWTIGRHIRLLRMRKSNPGLPGSPPWPVEWRHAPPRDQE